VLAARGQELTGYVSGDAQRIFHGAALRDETRQIGRGRQELTVLDLLDAHADCERLVNAAVYGRSSATMARRWAPTSRGTDDAWTTRRLEVAEGCRGSSNDWGNPARSHGLNACTKPRRNTGVWHDHHLMEQPSVPPRTLPDALLAEGVAWITTSAIAERVGIRPDQVPDSLERSRAAGRMRSITKGARLVVPPEYLGWVAPPPEHYVDAWMRHLGHAYYAGLLTAAARHDLAHHAAQVFHVVTSARLRDRTIGRSKIAFVDAKHCRDRQTVRATVPTGQLVVSSLAVTLLDLVSHPDRSGRPSNVASIAALALEDGRLDGDALEANVATYRVPVV